MSSHFYQTHARDYFNQTIEVDPSSFLLPFAKHLTPGSKVLDVGCGSGRDMLWLTERGFHCTGLERCPDHHETGPGRSLRMEWCFIYGKNKTFSVYPKKQA